MSYVLLFLTDILIPFLIIRSRKAVFSKANLQSDEEIIAIGKTHWIVLSIIVILQVIITMFSIEDILTRNHNWGLYLFYIILFILLWSQVVTMCREFVVTTKRILLKIGIISRTIIEYRYEKMESCDVNQFVLGRLLNYGTIIISGVGGSKVKEPYVQAPLEFRQYLIDQINNKNASDTNAIGQSVSSQFDTIKELRSYKKLFDEGVITKEDFEKKKQEILERK